MRRRRRRPPVALRLVPGPEMLEPRQLPTGTVSVQAATPIINVCNNVACAPFGSFDLAAAGALTGYINYTLTASNGAAVSLSYNGLSQPTPSGTLFVNTTGTITLVPNAAPTDDMYTLTLSPGSAPSGCSALNDFDAGSPPTASITYHYIKAEPPPFCPTGSPLAPSFDAQAGGAIVGAAQATGPIVRSTSDAGVQYARGAVQPTSGPFLISRGYGGAAAGLAPAWTNLPGYDPSFGSGIDNAAVPWIEPGPDGSIVAVAGAGDGVFFAYNSSTSTYSPEFAGRDTLAADGSGGYRLTQDDGSTLDFYGLGTGSGVPAAQQGQLRSMADAYGNATTTAYNGSGQLTATGRTDGTTAESYAYSYVASGVDAGLVSDVALRRGPDGGTLATIQHVALAYYDGSQAGGDAGELRELTLEDASNNPLGTTYYRYYTAADIANGASGYAGGLKYQLNPQSYARAAAGLPAGTTPETATDAQIAPYADQYYEYDPAGRVTRTVVQVAGCSCSGSTGQGSYSYAYSTSTNAPGPNSWSTETVETLPDGNKNYVFTNALGEVILSAFDDIGDAANPALDGQVWATYARYDADGREVLSARPSAVAITGLATLNSAAAAYPDIVGYNATSGAYAYLAASSGAIDLTDYGTSTTATATAAGNVAGYLQDHEVQHGYAGTPILLDSAQYLSHADSAGDVIYPVATSTAYRNADGTGAQTTSTAYTWYSGTNQVQSTAVSAPVVSAAQDGPGTADLTTTVYDADGRPTWARDGGGYIHYIAYDPGTGAVTKAIVDVDTSLTSEFTGLPAGWATPAGGGLNLITTAQVDAQGRTTEETSPAGNITYTVYDDPGHETRTYTGWDPLTGSATGPTQVMRQDWPASYSEILTMAAAPAVSGSAGSYVPTGTEAIAAVRTLARTYTDTGGRAIEDDAYSHLAGLTYSTAAHLGTLGTHYDRTTYGYDERGRQDLVENAVGTITIVKSDALGRPTSTYVGTDDSGFWTGGGSSNMTLVSQNQYDGNGVGDGNLTQVTESPDATASHARVTQDAYDWRNRLVAVKAGVQATEATSVHRPIVYRDLDNLGEVVALSQYDADGVTLSATRPGSGLLRAYVVTAYDDQGRAYEQQQYDVNQATGAVSASALTTSTYYDHRGDTIAVSAPGGRVTKDRYDGAGRVATESVTDAAGGSTWAEAATVAADHVLTQVDTTYDAAGRPIRVDTAQRVHDNTAALGSLVGPGSPAPPAAAAPTPTVIDNDTAGYTQVPPYQQAGGWIYFGYLGYNTTTEQAEAVLPGDATATATWTFTGLAAGRYTVKVTFPPAAIRATDAPYSVYDGNTLLGTVAVDQTHNPFGAPDANGVYWLALGAFDIAGGTLRVELTNQADGCVAADAVEILPYVPPAPVLTPAVIDNDTTGYTQVPAGQNDPGWVYFGYLGFNSTTEQAQPLVPGDAIAHADWAYGDIAPGRYEVKVTWPADASRATDAPYSVYDGNTLLGTVAVDQAVAPSGPADANGVHWLALGDFTITTGTLRIELTNQADGCVAADAVSIRFLTDARVSTATAYYDAAGRPTAVVDLGTNGGAPYTRPGTAPAGSDTALVTSYHYNDAGWVDRQTDPRGIVTATAYDALGRPTRVIAASDAAINGGLPTASANRTTDTTYDGLGHALTVTAVMPAGTASQTTTYAYGVTAAGGGGLADNDLLASVTQPGTSATASARARFLARDSTHQGTWQGTYGADGSAIADVIAGLPSYASLATTATAFAWASSTTDARALQDPATSGRIASAWGGSGAILTLDLNLTDGNVHQVALYALDWGDEDGGIVEKVQVVDAASGAVLDTESLSSFQGGQYLTWDLQGHVRIVVTATNGDAVVSGLFFDPGTISSFPATSATASYTYDSLGDVATATDPNGTTHTFAYDVLGRRVSDAVTVLGAGVDGAVRRLDTAYDTGGRASLFTSYDQPSGGSVVNQVEDTFNGLGQLTGMFQEHNGAVNPGTTPGVQYSYTEMAGGQDNSRPVSMTYPDGRVLDYVYNTGIDSAISRPSALADDSSGTPGTVLESYSYLGLGRVISWDRPQPGIDLTYARQAGDTSAVADGGDQYTGLDRFGRVIDQDWVTTATGASTARYQYGHDRSGDVLYRADLVDAALSELYHANSAASGDSATAYDALGRLTGFARGTLSASGHNGTTPDTIASPSAGQSWALDALGNMTGVTTNGSTVTKGFNALDQQTSNSAGAAPTYDADGNTTSHAGLASVYDAWNRLVAVSDAATGAATAAYAYDALGERITESYPGSGTVNHLYYTPGWQVVEERQGGTAAADVHYQYVWGATGDLVLRDTVASGTVVAADRLYAEQDANGDVTALVNASGVVQERYAYSPYGVVTVLTASGTPVTSNVSGFGWEYLFQCGRRDAATGLYLFEHRDYNPTEGTWTERDPLGLAAGDENLYRFVGNGPTDRVDPTGLDWTFGGVTYVWPWEDGANLNPINTLAAYGQTTAVTVSGGLGGGSGGSITGGATWGGVGLLAGGPPGGLAAGEVGFFGGGGWGGLAGGWNALVNSRPGTTVAQSFAQNYDLGWDLGPLGPFAFAGLGKPGPMPSRPSGPARVPNGSFPTTTIATRTPNGLYGGVVCARGPERAPSAGSGQIYVIGRRPDTAIAQGWPGHSILDDPEWTLQKNDAWVQMIIGQRGRVYVGSPMKFNNVWDPITNREIIMAREVNQFVAAGYMWAGDWLLPPAIN